MPYSHYLAHVLSHGLLVRFIPNERVRLIALAAISAACAIAWLFYRNENAWRGLELACGPVIESLCHLGASHAASVESEVAEAVEQA